MTIIANYIRQQPQHQTQLTEIYQAILAVVPQETTEKIAYGMPTFYLNGNLVHFAAAKQHWVSILRHQPSNVSAKITPF